MSLDSRNRTVAVFDLDGTLTFLETSTFIVIHTYGFWRSFFKLLALLPDFIKYFLKIHSRKKIKEILLSHYFLNKPVEFLHKNALSFFVKNGWWAFRSKTVKELFEHKRRGETVVIVSANIYPIVSAIKDVFPVDHIIATEIEEDKEKKITGRIKGVNCWGPEKLKRFIELMGDKSTYRLIVYGDSLGDKELLEYADVPHKI